MPATGAAARPPAEPIEETLFEWLQLHTRELLIAVGVVVVLGAGVMFYRSAVATQAMQADQALVSPEQSMAAGNIPLAQSDLKKVMTRFKGTPAAAQAALLLAQTYYDQHKVADGLAVLRQVMDQKGATAFAPALESMVADGYIQDGKFADAAAHFSAAADRSRYPAERARLRASAARSYMSAGNGAAALKIWTELAADPKSSQAQEARLRIGELTAKAAGKA